MKNVYYLMYVFFLIKYTSTKKKKNFFNKINIEMSTKSIVSYNDFKYRTTYAGLLIKFRTRLFDQQFIDNVSNF